MLNVLSAHWTQAGLSLALSDHTGQASHICTDLYTVCILKGDRLGRVRERLAWSRPTQVALGLTVATQRHASKAACDSACDSRQSIRCCS